MKVLHLFLWFSLRRTINLLKRTFYLSFHLGSNVGCYDLLQAVQQRESLKAVIFGHVHHSYGAAQQDNKLFINAAQYNGIYHGDVRNEPYEISMRRVDKSIVRVNPMPMTTDTKGSTNESNLRTPIYENRNDKNAKAKI